METVLVCNRADAPMTTRGASFSHHCGTCKARVMMAPTSQRLLKQAFAQKISILCAECYRANVAGKPDNIHAIAAPVEEIRREFLTQIPNTWRNRN